MSFRMSCDECGIEMGEDETGVYILATKMGGHMACFREPMSEEEAKEIAAHHQRLSGRSNEN